MTIAAGWNKSIDNAVICIHAYTLHSCSCAGKANCSYWKRQLLSEPKLYTNQYHILNDCLGLKKYLCFQQIGKKNWQGGCWIFLYYFCYLSRQDLSAKLNYIFLYTFYFLSILTAHFIYINYLLFAWIELLSKGDFKDTFLYFLIYQRCNVSKYNFSV